MNRTLILLAILLAPLLAMATGKPAPAAPATSATSSSASAFAAGDHNGHIYLLPNPGGTSALPAGMCQVGDSESVGGLSFFKATSRTRIDMDCMRMLVEIERARGAPPPAAKVELLTAQPSSAVPKPEVAAARAPVCTPLAKTTKLGAGCPR